MIDKMRDEERGTRGQGARSHVCRRVYVGGDACRRVYLAIAWAISAYLLAAISPSFADESRTEATEPVVSPDLAPTEDAVAAVDDDDLNSFLDEITPEYEAPPEPEPVPPPTGGESGEDLLVPTFRDDGVEVMPSLGDFVKEDDEDPEPEAELDIAELRSATARQMLEHYGIDESQLCRLVDGVPMEENNETLIKILYRMPQVGSMQMLRWTREDVTWDEVVEDPTEFRAEVFPLRGRVKFVEPVDLADEYPEMAQRWEFAKYFRVTIQLDDSPYPVLIFVRRFGLNSEFAPIPDRWVKAAAEGTPLDERASCQGMFLKLGGDSAGYLQEGEATDDDEQPQLLFAAQRVAWHPDNRDASAKVSDDLVLLGEAGMDVGLLDTVRMGGPLQTQDREAFYQMLTAMRGVEDKEIERPPVDNSFEAMMEDPQRLQGKFVTMKGVAHRATRLRVKDPDIAKRLGIDHYYEVYVFVALDQSIVFTKSKESREGLRYSNAYPIVFCVRSLPPGMEEGENIHERVKISGFFFKLYEYRTAYAAQQNEATKQRSPMIIGLVPELIPDKDDAGGYAQVILGVCFVVALLAIWLLIWYFGRTDKKFNDSTIAGRYEVADGKSLNEMGIEASDGPDFSGLSGARDEDS